MAIEDQTTTQEPEVIDYRFEMISSRRVEGTPVFDRNGDKLGEIHSLMINKKNGQVGYAVLEFGGVLGAFEKVHPIPWALLDYDVDLDGYVVDITREQLDAAPALHLDETDRPVDRAYEESMTSYWKTMPWWGL
jgi:sporulation protein YlmC with PRC-barrel domain